VHNSFGRVFRVTTWGESHGPAVGVVIDGCPAGLELPQAALRRELDRDVPEPSVGTTRHEPNEFQILSGVYDGRTLGTPICVVIPNVDVDSSPYKAFSGVPRPGHADLTWWLRYGWVDPRGGGRASGRECVARLVAGAVAKLLLAPLGVAVTSEVIELAGRTVSDRPSLQVALDEVRRHGGSGDTTGGRLLVTARGVPAGLGAPVFHKLQADMAAAFMSIGGVKGVEVGAGAALSAMTGHEANDAIVTKRGRPATRTNRCGGVLGGITTGGELSFTLAVKPTPTHRQAQQSIDITTGRKRTIACKGRHDLNFTPRVAPDAEAMAALVLVDQAMSAGLVPMVRCGDERGGA